MWRALRPKIRRLDPVRIESPITPGVPDVNYANGWIELKWVARWPPREGPLRVDHFTQEQRAWLRRRKRAGGRVFLLLKVGTQEWLLFDGAIAAVCIGRSTREQLYEACLARWTRLPKTEELYKWL